MSKFGALTANTEKPFRVHIKDVATTKVIRQLVDADGQKLVDAEGRPNGPLAYIDVLPDGGIAANQFDKEERERVAQEAAAGNLLTEPDAVLVRKRKTARLTTGWFLVDPDTGEHLDVPCTEENALELYKSESLMAQSVWVQAWIGCQGTANFIKRSAKPSSGTPSTDSAKAAN